uniref:Small ribosomal subunit protein uS4c n=1 Tax=Cibotium barometz TaxID=29588 RepID=A0A2S1PV48_CIBBA|nr:ribosomal protein S4 [Cibotium barometz]YP_010878725.1 ribosomal protein S4 [Cibotium cumingii]WHE38180.1 ribosomal protein S4 [Cibotium sinoburmaense]AWH62704.1 ribosomal protein S4 [Cibotium barometz]WHE37918.1 ribosomal protein S4 [Cibotium barometz]WHE38005.1 ribosomal protein S4 [Cibotium barometz]WHE38093.1 ribosomal protein S4 [Cibotium barometz]
MSRYRGPRLKVIRRLKDLPGLTGKASNPGETRVAADQSTSRKISQFCVRLEAKQRLRFNYGLTERQLLRYVRIARKTKGSTGQVPLQLLEMRLDNIIFHSGMASTIPAARQLVNHRHIVVNDRIVDVPSYRCKPKDIITVRNRPTSSNVLRSGINESSRGDEIPDHLTLSLLEGNRPKGLVNRIANRESIDLNINELLVVEYYSRKA